ncbi:DUF4129 domain-containing protein, partial [Streptomyces sp. YS-3]|uniref:DUF4129 domain-containing protein n=1 Tax=Streptomyces sp. YS-3 TaxID=3381352 RepID=UPI003862A71A
MKPSEGPSTRPSAAPAPSSSCPAQLRKQNECGEVAPAAPLGGDGGGTSAATVAAVTLGVLAALVLPLLPWLWRVRVRSRRLARAGHPDADPVTATLTVWREVIDTAWDHGIVPDDSLTPRKAAARMVRLGGLDGPAAESVHRAASAVEQVLYAPTPRPPTGLSEAAHDIRAGLRASLRPWP